MSDPKRPTSPFQLIRDLLRRLRGAAGRPSTRSPEAERLRRQVAVIRREFEKHKQDAPVAAPAVGGRRVADDADVQYLFRSGHALVTQDAVPRIRDYLEAEERRDLFEGELREKDSPTEGLVLVALPQRRDGADDVLATLDDLEKSGVIREGEATPDHVVYVCILGRMCPATEPEVPRSRRPWPPQASYDKKLAEDEKIRVAVVDTGLWKQALDSNETPWLESDDVFADGADTENVNGAAIHEYAGHGTFVAGVIECLAPETHIDVEGALPYGGAVYESRICRQIEDALKENRPHVVSISAGTHTRGGHPMLSFVLLAQNNKFDERDDVLIVAAAGNDGSNERFWPAAFAEHYPWVVSVGSVDPDKKVSDFSNYGKDWVSVYARGRNLVNAFPKGTYKCYEPPNVGEVRKFNGLAQWSGTSFSTPIVTGLIAAEMRDHGLSARAAWDVVRKTAITHHDSRIGEDIEIVGPLT